MSSEGTLTLIETGLVDGINDKFKDRINLVKSRLGRVLTRPATFELSTKTTELTLGSTYSVACSIYSRMIFVSQMQFEIEYYLIINYIITTTH